MIAIIGHGRSPEGRGWGDRIDQCLTVRMWDWQWQDRRDYGTRYDYGFFEAHPLMMRAFATNRTGDPAIGWLASVLGDLKRCIVPDGTDLIRQDRWTDLGRQMGGMGRTGNLKFTRGTIAACWAIESGLDDEVVLVGFDHVRAGRTFRLDQAFSPAYRNNPGTFSFKAHRGGVDKAGNHDFAIERPVLVCLARMNGIKLSFAQDVW